MITGSNPTSYEARLGSDGAWVDIGSEVLRSGKNYFYTFTGLSPLTEYTFYIRATANGSAGSPISFTGSTISAATDYDVRFCQSGADVKLLFSGLNSPGNAGNKFQLFAAFYLGHATTTRRVPYNHDDIPSTTREVNLGGIAAGERLFIEFLQVSLETGFSVTERKIQIFGGDALPPCSSGSGSGSGSGQSSGPPKPTATPVLDTINHLPPGIHVSNWVFGAQGQRVDAVGAGRPDVINPAEFIDGVNIWGYVTPGIEVCFTQPGRLLFIDSVYPPIDPYALPAHQRDGMTCGSIDTAGTVVLLSSGPPPPPPPSQTLNGCELRPWADLNFRQSPPDGAVIGVTAIRDWLPASEKLAGYFKVRLWDVEGWISGDYVYTRGDCGA